MVHEALNSKRTQELYKLIFSLKTEGSIKAGYNVAVKSVKNSTALLVVIAKDAEPTCLVEPLPVFCEQKGVPFVFVESKTALGKACGLEVDVLACALTVPKHEDTASLSTKIAQALK